jgi:hypothetical protein
MGFPVAKMLAALFPSRFGLALISELETASQPYATGRLLHFHLSGALLLILRHLARLLVFQLTLIANL